MGKFDRYVGKLKFKAGGEDFEVAFLVEDRIAIASVYDHKDMETRYKMLIDICSRIISRSYPDESKESINGFLVKYVDEFYTRLMVASGITTEQEMESAKEAVKKEKLQ